MLFSSQRKNIDTNSCKIQFNNINITRVKQTQFLGIIIDEHMSLKYHIEYLCNKISKTSGILLRTCQMLFGNTLYLLYNSLIKPYLMYGIIVCCNTYKKYFEKVSLGPKRNYSSHWILRFVCHYCTTQQMGIINVNNLHVYFTAILIFKSLNNKTPIYFTKLFNRNYTQIIDFNLRSTYRTK